MPHSTFELPTQLVETRRWDELAELLTSLRFLEAKAGAGKVFELARDFSRAINAMPPDHPQTPVLRLIEGALRTDIHFIAQHPGALFQCLWNKCWWYDCTEAAKYYDPPASGWPPEGPPWERPGPKLAALMESWRKAKVAATPGFHWIRSLRPPPFPLGAHQRAVFRGDWQGLRGLAFSSDGQRIIAWCRQPPGGAATGKSLRVWEWTSGTELADPREEAFPFPDPAVSPDRRRCLRHEAWAPLRLCDAATDAAITVFSAGHDGDENVSCVAFSPDGRRIVSGTYDEEGCGAIHIWDAATGTRPANMRMLVDGMPWAVAFSPDGQRLVSGHSTGAVQVWDASNGRLLLWLTGHEGSADAVAFSPDGQRIVSGSRKDGTIRVWDSAEGPVLGHLKGHQDSLQEIVFSTDGQRLVTRSANQTVWLWSAGDGVPVACLYQSFYVVLEGGGARHSLFADGQHVVHLSTEGIKVWDAVHGAAVSHVPSQGYFWYSHVVFSLDGRRCLVCGHDAATAEVRDTDTGACLANLEGHEGKITCIAFSPDGQRVASGSGDGTIRLWDACNGAQLACMRGHEGLVTSVAFSPDGQRIASGSVDKTVRTWDSAAGTELACLRIDDPGVWCWGWSAGRGEYVTYGVSAVAFTADGQQIVTLSRSGKPFLSETHTSRVWDERSGVCLKTLQGIGSFPAICAGSRWQAVIRGPEVEITSAETGQVVVRLPAALECLTAHPSGRIWAGSSGKYLYHFALEGSEPEQFLTSTHSLNGDIAPRANEE
jgi:WD40 repeat protein